MQDMLLTNLYDINKQLMNKRELLSEKTITHEIAGIAAWFSYEADKYFMLLCHERRDYTIIHFMGRSKHCYEAGQELKETLQNRGEILDISYENESGVYSIWIRADADSFLYHLFPYNLGVIEV